MGAGEVLIKFAPFSVLTRIACPHHPWWQSTRGGAPRTSLGTSNQCTHPTHKLTTWHVHPWPPAHTAWPTSTPYAVCVFDSLWAVFVGPPVPASLVHPTQQAVPTPWPALRGDIKGQALAWDSPCTHTHTQPHAHGVARDAQPHLPLDVLQCLHSPHSLLMCIHGHVHCSS